jgi:hypothetical protein
MTLIRESIVIKSMHIGDITSITAHTTALERILLQETIKEGVKCLRIHT